MGSITQLLKTFNSFALFTHISPDGDALGSCNALKIALKSMGKKAYIYCDGQVPRNFDFMKVTLEKNENHIPKVDVCLMLDCNNLGRIGKYADAFAEAKIKACIDHHQPEKTNQLKFNCSFVDSKSPSTSDLVMEIIKTLGVNITKEIAVNLYAGLASDTGCFQHSTTTPTSHMHACELMEKEFDLEEINYKLFKYKPKRYLEFYKTALRSTKSYLSGRLFVAFVNYKTYQRFYDICENSASFQFLDGIDGNEVRAKIIEKEPGVFHMSLRSNLYANVCNIARSFGGGGHVKAAGATVTGKYKDVLNKIIEQTELELQENEKKSKK